MSVSSTVIFTGVDGMLRGAETPSLADARAAMDLLRRDEVSVVLCTDQSASQLMWLQQELGIRQPFICENGAAVYIPAGYFEDIPDLGRPAGEWEIIEFGPPHSEVLAALHRTAERLKIGIVGFHDLPVERIASEAKITMFEAQLAKRRDYDEPFRIVEGGADAKTRLFAAMRGTRLRCFSGSRYCHATGVRDPGSASRLLMTFYRAASATIFTIGVGDDRTAGTLLRQVDVPIVVRNRAVDQRRLLRQVPSAYLTDAVGPAGWTEAILGYVVAAASADGDLPT